MKGSGHRISKMLRRREAVARYRRMTHGAFV
jgi:hypothetical protein